MKHSIDHSTPPPNDRLCGICWNPTCLDQFWDGTSICKRCYESRKPLLGQAPPVPSRTRPGSRIPKMCSRCHGVPIKRGSAYCPACRADMRKASLEQDGTTAKDKLREIALKRNHNMSMAEYDVMLQAQGGACSICDGLSGTRQFHVDHDHVTGKVRALLCNGCNTGLGMFKDDPARLRAAADYLEKHT